MRPRSLAALAWAYAAAGHSHPQLWAVISEVARESIADFSPHSLSVLAWSAGTARIADPALFVALSERSLVVLESFDGCSLGLLLQGFAKAGQRCPELLAAVAGGIAAEPEVAAKPGEIAKIVAAFASFGYSTEESQVRCHQMCVCCAHMCRFFLVQCIAGCNDLWRAAFIKVNSHLMTSTFADDAPKAERCCYQGGLVLHSA